MNPKSGTPSDQDTARLDQLKAALDAAGVKYTLLAHDRLIQSAEDGAEHGFGGLANMAPTFILRSGSSYLAAVIRGDTRLSYKKIKKELHLKDISLATPEQVREVTGAEVGYVSLVNPGMATLVDSRLLEMGTIYGGCGVPYYTLQMDPRDLVAAVQARAFDFTELKKES